ncbi:hypothetical protein SCHPADRAFT_995208 [Schizopora paradoxa]|uniref:Uncharacterized protein n=1 Tax=Schizopora paradoxa TaxID=27342 RepID=A0A0H2RWG0_9AGAM|nr:hypothetical protein SCHPADRAFT_995208 [Schizopora paradoxa]
MAFEGWLKEGDEIRHCVHGHYETLEGLEYGNYVLRAGLAIEYDRPLCDIRNLYNWEDAKEEVLNDCREMRISVPRHLIVRRGNKGALCFWEFRVRGSSETAQDIFERGGRFRRNLARRLTATDLIECAMGLRIREMRLLKWYIVPCSAPLTSEYVCETYRSDLFEMCFDSDDESQASSSSTEWTSESSVKAQSPTITNPIKSLLQEQVPVSAPVLTAFTAHVPRRACSIPPSVPASSNSRIVPQSSTEQPSEDKVKATTTAHARSTNPPSVSPLGISAQGPSAHTQNLCREPVKAVTHTASEQLPHTRTRDPRRRPTLTQETSQDSVELSMEAGPSSRPDSSSDESIAVQRLDQRTLKFDPKSPQITTTSEVQRRGTCSNSAMSFSTEAPAVSAQRPNIGFSSLATPSLASQRIPVVQSPISTPSSPTNAFFDKSVVGLPSTPLKQSSNSDNPGRIRETPTSSPTIPEKRPRDGDEEKTPTGKKKLKPMESLFLPPRRSSAPTLSPSKSLPCPGLSGEARLPSISSTGSDSSMKALQAKNRFLEKQHEKDLARLDSLFGDDNGEKVSVLSIERKINLLRQRGNADSTPEPSFKERRPGSPTPSEDLFGMEVDRPTGLDEIGPKDNSYLQGAFEDLRKLLEQAHIDRSQSNEDAKTAREEHETEVRMRCEVEKARDALMEQLKASESQRKDLEEQISTARKLEKEHSDRAFQLAASLEKAVNDASAEKKAAAQLYERLFKDYDGAAESLRKVTLSLSEERERSNVLSSELSRVESEARSVSSELEDVKKSLSLAEEELVQTTDNLRSAQKEASGFNEELSNLRQSHKQVVQDKRAAEKLADSRRVDLERTTAEHERASSEKDAQIESLGKALKEKTSALDVNVSRLNDELSNLRQSHSQAIQDKCAADELVNSYRVELEKKEAELERASSETKVDIASIGNAYNERASALHRTISLKNEEALNLQQAYSQITQEKNTAVELSNSLHAQLEQTRADLWRMSSEKDGQIASAENALKEKISTLQEYAFNAAQVEERYRSAVEQLGETRALNKSLKERLSSAQGNVFVQGVLNSVDHDRLLKAEGRAIEAEARAADEEMKRLAMESLMDDLIKKFSGESKSNSGG